jgi:hypothetical protein
MDWTTEKIFRTVTELIAQLVGFVVAGIYIWREIKKQKDFDYIDYEFLNTDNYE